MDLWKLLIFRKYAPFSAAWCMRHWTGLGAPDGGRGREGEDRQTEILRMRAWGDPRFHLLPPHWPFASKIQKQSVVAAQGAPTTWRQGPTSRGV